MELTREQERRTYRLALTGFAFLSVALVLASFQTVGNMVLLFGFNQWQGLAARVPIPNFEAYLASAVTWSKVLALVFLLGRWDTGNWKRRTFLLFLIFTADVVLWFLEYGQGLGLLDQRPGGEWIRRTCYNAMAWVKFPLYASLAADVASHLGNSEANAQARSVKALALMGAFFWFFQFLSETAMLRPGRGVPRRAFRNFFLMMIGTNLIWTVALVKAMLLTVLAARLCGDVLRRMDIEDRDDDLLGFR